ncbi:ABC transporter substrate-binding protein, partial [Candidatus Bathyarchaeota archaeon]|nr:ABC transporter substrate-binding protein [Candidatus Bathyarchaeota archaeon]
GFVKGNDGWRIDPRTNTTMRAIDIIARTEHPHRLFSARQLKLQMDAIGIPNKLEEISKSVASPRVIFEQDYDVYTAGWGGGPDIDWLYDLFHSTSPPAQNWSLFKNSTVDTALNMLKFGSNYTSVLKGAQDAQRYLSEQVPFIPLYAKAYISPYNTRLKNVVDLPWRQGVTNWMTFFYARDKIITYGGTLKVGWTSNPQQPSPMYEINWWWDGMLVDTVYEYLINADPKTFMEIPWLAKSWTVEQWMAPGSIPGLKITFNLVNNATWHDGTALTADDVIFTWKYAQQQRNPVYLSYVLNLVDATAPSKTIAVAYLNTTSYWALHWLGENIPIIPKSIWKDVVDSVHYKPVRDGKLIGSGPYRFKENKPNDYVLLEANPNYWREPKDNTLSYTPVTLTAEGFLMAGETKTYTKIATVNGKPITNGTFTLNILKSTGEVIKTVTGTVATDGTYSAKLDTAGIQPGTYILSVDLKVPATDVGLGSSDKYQLVVKEAPPNYAVVIVMLFIIIASVSAVYILIRRRDS